MATQQFLSENKLLSKKFDDIFDDNLQPYNSIITNKTLISIKTVFSNDVYIPVLIEKFWDFTLKILENYAEWSKNINL